MADNTEKEVKKLFSPNEFNPKGAYGIFEAIDRQKVEDMPTESIWDNTSAGVQQLRVQHNQNPRDSRYAKSNGDFAVNAAFKDVFKSLSYEEQEAIKTIFPSFNERVNSFKKEWANVGKYYSFDDRSGTRRTIPYRESSRRSPGARLREFSKGWGREIREMVGIPVMLAGEADWWMNKPRGEASQLLQMYRNKYEERIAEGKLLPQFAFGFAPTQTAVTEPYTQEEIAEIRLDMEREFLKEWRNTMTEPPPPQDVIDIAIFGDKLGKRYSDAVQSVYNFLEEDYLGYSTDDYKGLAELTMGDVQARQFWEGMIPTFFTGPWSKSALGRVQIMKEANKPKLGAFGLFRNPNYSDALKIAPYGNPSNRLAAYLDVIAKGDMQKNRARVWSRSMQFIMGPAIRPFVLADEILFDQPKLNWGTKVTRGNALRFAQQNPEIASQALYFSGLTYVTANFIEQSMERENYGLFGFETNISTPQGAWSGVKHTFALTGAFVGAPILAKLSGQGILNSIPVYKMFDAVGAVLKNSGYEGLKGLEELMIMGSRAVSAQTLGMSYDFLKGLSNDQVNNIYAFLEKGGTRATLVDITKNLRMTEMERGAQGAELAAVGKQLFFEKLEQMQGAKEMLIDLRDNKGIKQLGKFELSDENIEMITAQTFGNMLGIPLLEGLEENIKGLKTTVHANPLTNIAANLIEIGQQEQLLSLLKDEQTRNGILVGALIEEMRTLGAVDATGKGITSDKYASVRMWAENIKTVSDNQIIDRNFISEKLIQSADELGPEGTQALVSGNADLDLLIKEVDQMKEAGADLDHITRSYNLDRDPEFIENMKRISQTVSNVIDEHGGVFGPLQAIKLKNRTHQQNVLFLDSVLKWATNTKTANYDKAFYVKIRGGKVPLLISKKNLDNLNKRFSESEGFASMDRGWYPRPRVLKGTDVEAYPIDLVDEALDVYKDGITNKITSLQKRIAESENPISEIPIDVADLTDQLAYYTKMKETIFPLIDGASDQGKKDWLKRIVDNNWKNGEKGSGWEDIQTKIQISPTDKRPPTSADFKFNVYRVEDLYRQRSMSLSTYTSGTAKGVDNAQYSVPALNYILENAPTYILDAYADDIITANNFYKNVTAFLKAREIKNFKKDQKYGQAFIDKGDELINLFNEMETDDLISILTMMEADKKFVIQRSLDKKGDFIKTADGEMEVDEMEDIFSVFSSLLKDRMANRFYLKENYAGYAKNEEKILRLLEHSIAREQNGHPSYWSMDDLEIINTLEDIQGGFKGSPEGGLKESILTGRYQGMEKEMLYSRIIENPTARQLLDSLDLENVNLAEQSIFTAPLASRTVGKNVQLSGKAGVDDPAVVPAGEGVGITLNQSTILEQYNSLPSNVQTDFKNYIYDGILDKYLVDATKQLVTTPLEIRGKIHQVPAIWEIFRKNGEFLTEVLGADQVDRIIRVTNLYARARMGGLAKEIEPPILSKLSSDSKIAKSKIVPSAVKEQLLKKSEIELSAGETTGGKAVAGEDLLEGMEAYREEFAPEIRSIKEASYTPEARPANLSFTGINEQQISQLLGGRLYNMARGFVSPTYVGIELVLKSMPKKSLALIEYVLTGGGTLEGTQAAINVIDDFFYSGNLSGMYKTYNPLQALTHKNLIVYGLTGMGIEDFDKDKINLDELAFDMTRTNGEKLSEEEIRTIVADIVTNIRNASDEQMAEILASPTDFL